MKYDAFGVMDVFTYYIATLMQHYFASFLLICVTLGLGLSPARAQYSSNWVGVRAGLNIASEGFNQMPDGASSGRRLGPIMGGQFEHWFGDTWALSVGLLFDQKGSNQRYDSSSTAQFDTVRKIAYGGNDDFALSYIEIPILAKWTMGYGNLQPYVFAGPSIGILMSASETADGTVPPVADLKSAMQSIDMSLCFGGGIVKQLSYTSKLFFDVSYAAGLTKVFKSNPRATPNFIDLSTATSGDIRIALGMLWQL